MRTNPRRLAILGSALLSLTVFSAPAWSYDADLAARFAEMFAPAKEQATAKELHFVKPEGLLNLIKKGEPLVALDVRTPMESSVFTMALPGSLSIPINELFLPENLARLPEDRPVVILCQSGLRAGMAVAGLRHIGFEKVFALQGGYKALINDLSPITAYSPLPAPQPGQ